MFASWMLPLVLRPIILGWLADKFTATVSCFISGRRVVKRSLSTKQCCLPSLLKYEVFWYEGDLCACLAANFPAKRTPLKYGYGSWHSSQLYLSPLSLSEERAITVRTPKTSLSTSRHNTKSWRLLRIKAIWRFHARLLSCQCWNKLHHC